LLQKEQEEKRKHKRRMEMAKIFTYRGFPLEKLKEMSLKEFSKLVDSRKRRTLSRGFNKKLLKKILRQWELKKAGKDPKPIRTHLRSTVVIPAMVGLTFAIYNGKEFVPIGIQEEMLGHYLGEFSLTRKKLKHGKAGIGATKSSTAITARG
jgi:small subunit ribosomal protein S19